MIRLLPLLFLAGCRLPDLEVPDRFVDLDSDGWTEAEGDCAPRDDSIHPDADEVCDEVDNDCDDETDEIGAVDGALYYEDGDNDDYGDPLSFVQACSRPAGYVANDQDCNDDNDLVHPGVDDTCNSNDDDCDGVYDEDSENVWFGDFDQDGYGNPIVPDCTSASQPENYVDNHDDCDDSDWLVNPDAVELCNEIDDDCDGTVDAGARDAPPWCLDDDGDTTGTPTDVLYACDNPDPAYVEDCTDCDDNSADTVGAESCRWPEQIDLSSDPLDLTLDGGTVRKETGSHVFFLDLDADGLSDALIQSHDVVHGKLDVMYGASVRTLGNFALIDQSDVTISAAVLATSHQFGTAVAALSDTNSDDLREVLVGDPMAVDTLGAQTGAVYVMVSNAGDYTVGLELTGEEDGDELGSAITSVSSFGGLDDVLVVSAPGFSSARGKVYFLTTLEGVSSGNTIAQHAEAMTGAADSSMQVGISLASGPMADPWDALVIGARRVPSATGGDPDDRGLVLVFRGGPDSQYSGLDDAELTIAGEAGSDGHFGAAVAMAGDVDGDGTGDLLVGAPDFDAGGRINSGRVYLISGAIPDGEYSVEVLPSDLLLATFDGPENLAKVGSVLAGAGNVDGDVYDDIALGVPRHDIGGTSNAGAVYLFYGGPGILGSHDLNDTSEPDRVALFRDSEGFELGAAVAIDGDMDGDGHGELLIGAPGALSGDGSVGMLYGEGF